MGLFQKIFNSFKSSKNSEISSTFSKEPKHSSISQRKEDISDSRKHANSIDTTSESIKKEKPIYPQSGPYFNGTAQGTHNDRTGREGLALINASLDGDYVAVGRLLNRGVDPNVRNDDGITALHCVCTGVKMYNTMIAAMLLNAGADADARANNGATPLMLAARLGLTEIVSLLLENGADPNVCYEDGLAPLHLLCSAKGSHSSEVAEMLIRSGADVDARDNDGTTPLMFAAFHGLDEAARLLLANGADPNVCYENGLAPLHLLCSGEGSHSFEVAEALIRSGADVDARDNNGTTPLMLAVRLGLTEIVSLLLENGANLD